MGLYDDILVGIGVKTEDDVKADKIISMDKSRIQCGYDERSQEQRDKDNEFMRKRSGKRYY